jgi:hypothetical protein
MPGLGQLYNRDDAKAAAILCSTFGIWAGLAWTTVGVRVVNSVWPIMRGIGLRFFDGSTPTGPCQGRSGDFCGPGYRARAQRSSFGAGSKILVSKRRSSSQAARRS